MKNLWIFLLLLSGSLGWTACGTRPATSDGYASGGLRIVYVNGDSILKKYIEFREASESISAKQQAAEQQLQVKMQELDRQITAYQRKAQAGTMSPKEMQSEEVRLGGLQQELQAESDALSRELMTEMDSVNRRLQKTIKDKLREIKEKEGYDFVLNSMDGGPILVADEKHDITERVLRELNQGRDTFSGDSMDRN